ncbi:MAG: homogentisate 1,2-dioxygenase [Gammaproteobacteria bacterium]|nr:homogentisate 1,2-dioxygenase [Gammaproteobacteria bacterium]
MKKERSYLRGFRNYHETEALPGALPREQNSPQKLPYGLYAEQVSGSAFTSPRASTLKSWLYRMRPAVLHSGEDELCETLLQSKTILTPPTQFRWNPQPYQTGQYSLLEGAIKYMSNGTAGQDGCAIYLYTATRSMKDEFFVNHDGEMLFIPQEGTLLFKTELGELEIKPGEIVVIPCGIIFQVILLEPRSRGYFTENYGQPFKLLDRGVIGANGTTEERDFLVPVAAFEERSGDFTLFKKFGNHIWKHGIQHSPLDIVAWHGSYYPYKYDLRLFKPMFTASVDHPDPSIFVVLSAPSCLPGTSNLDFVIFPERWMVAEHTFRPPYYHRNIMSEFMGNIEGTYDAKADDFAPGSASLHNCMAGHGPDQETYDHAVKEILTPKHYVHNLAFMLESNKVFQLTEAAYESPLRQKTYQACWKGLKFNFNK